MVKLMLFVFGQTNTCTDVVFEIASFFGETTAAPNFGKCNIILFPKSFPEKTRQENFISVSDSWGESTFSHICLLAGDWKVIFALTS